MGKKPKARPLLRLTDTEYARMVKDRKRHLGRMTDAEYDRMWAEKIGTFDRADASPPSE